MGLNGEEGSSEIAHAAEGPCECPRCSAIRNMSGKPRAVGFSPEGFKPPAEPNRYVNPVDGPPPSMEDMLSESFTNEEGARLTGSQRFSTAQRQAALPNPATAGRLPPLTDEEMAGLDAEGTQSSRVSWTLRNGWWFPHFVPAALERLVEDAEAKLIPDPDPGAPTDEDLVAIWNGQPVPSLTNEERARAFLGWDATYDRVLELARLLGDAEARGTTGAADVVRDAMHADGQEARGVISQLFDAARHARRAAQRDPIAYLESLGVTVNAFLALVARREGRG